MLMVNMMLKKSFLIYSLQPDQLRDLSHVIMEELRRLASEVSETEVTRARNQVILYLLSRVCLSSL